jgi:hypothetical protein
MHETQPEMVPDRFSQDAWTRPRLAAKSEQNNMAKYLLFDIGAGNRGFAGIAAAKVSFLGRKLRCAAKTTER